MSGNYFSLRGDHSTAIAYFKKALRLDCRYVSAWTLLGHEYVEMANTHAAIDAYRQACSGSCNWKSIISHRLNNLTSRDQLQGLPCLVRLRSSVRVAGHAGILARVLPTRVKPEVCFRILPAAVYLMTPLPDLSMLECGKPWRRVLTSSNGQEAGGVCD